MKRHSLALVAAIVALAACGAAPPSPSPSPSPTASPTPSPSPTPELLEILGTFTLNSGSTEVSLDTGYCSGTGGYDDIAPGLGVVVKDQSGTILATGALSFLRFDGASDPDLPGIGFGSCTFSFRIRSVPRATFYEVEVGHRGGLTYSYDELRQRSWHVELTLGDGS